MIRVATKDDRALILALLTEFKAEEPPQLWEDGAPAEQVFTAVLLADDVAFAALDRRDGRTWLLNTIYVKPEARGNGLGTELIRAAGDYAREQGGEMLALMVDERNAGARRLYDRLGFTTYDRVLAAPIAGLLAAPDPAETFGAVHVQNDDVEKVKRDAVKVLRREPDVTAANGWSRVDAKPDELRNLARELSFTTGVSVALSIEAGAVVRYVLFDRGSMVDEYLSVPTYFGELPPGDVYALGANPTVVARLTNADPARVRAVARTAASPAELPPAKELYEQIADVLGVQP